MPCRSVVVFRMLKLMFSGHSISTGHRFFVTACPIVRIMITKDNSNAKFNDHQGSEYLAKNVTTSNISYLIQYGRIPKHGNNGSVVVNRADLEAYYKAHHETQADSWKRQLGDDLNWDLSFSQYKESETTKHVHRLHPYKGKFIPQLVKYFLDCHTDDFKEKSFFKKGDIILDPFCGSGTMLVQANELGLNAVGIDISAFNAFISNVKIGCYQVDDVRETTLRITNRLKDFQKGKNNIDFEKNYWMN